MTNSATGTKEVMKAPFNKSFHDYSSRELTLTILKVLSTGVLVCSVLTLPGLGVAFNLFGVDNRRDRYRFARRMRTLEREGYIFRSTGQYVVTAKGQHLITEDEVWSLHIPRPKRWDGRWRVVLFDIPSKKQKARTAFRARLKELNFFQYQDSVFVHAFEVRSVITRIVKFYGISDHVDFMSVTTIDRSGELKEYFQL